MRTVILKLNKSFVHGHYRTVDGKMQFVSPYADSRIHRFKMPHVRFSAPGGELPPQPKDANSTDFTRWFGDWRSRPEKASKVVDDDGYPLPVIPMPSTFHIESDGFMQVMPQHDAPFGPGYYFMAPKEESFQKALDAPEGFEEVRPGVFRQGEYEYDTNGDPYRLPYRIYDITAHHATERGIGSLDLSVSKSGTRAHINNVEVESRHRGRGVGGALLALAAHLIRAQEPRVRRISGNLVDDYALRQFQRAYGPPVKLKEYDPDNAAEDDYDDPSAYARYYAEFALPPAATLRKAIPEELQPEPPGIVPMLHRRAVLDTAHDLNAQHALPPIPDESQALFMQYGDPGMLAPDPQHPMTGQLQQAAQAIQNQPPGLVYLNIRNPFSTEQALKPAVAANMVSDDPPLLRALALTVQQRAGMQAQGWLRRACGGDVIAALQHLDRRADIPRVLQAAGFDGILHPTPQGDIWVAFHRDQIRPVDSQGDFDGQPDDMYKALNEDLYDHWRKREDKAHQKVLNDFIKNPSSVQSWSVVPAGRLKKIWNDYGKMGFVRDEEGINSIANQMIDNVLKLHVNTKLAGHTEEYPEEIAARYGYEWTPEREEQFSDHITDPSGQWRISDYAMEPLLKDAFNLYSETVPENKLRIIDRMLNRVHQRSDLAGMFVEGGHHTLSDISGTGNIEKALAPLHPKCRCRIVTDMNGRQHWETESDACAKCQEAAQQFNLEQLQKETVVDALAKAAGDITGQPGPEQPFYSNLHRVLSAKMPNQAPPAMVRGLINAHGISQEEQQYSGVHEFLDNAQGKVRKEDVLNHIQQNLPQVQEVWHKPLQWEVSVSALDNQPYMWMYKNPVSGTRLRIMRNGKYYRMDQNGDFVGSYPTLEEAQQEANEFAGRGGYPIRYPTHTLPGGENYRELLFTLPDLGESDYNRLKQLQEQWSELGSEFPPQTRKLRAIESEMEELERRLKNTPDPFYSVHWDEPNVLAHARMNERRDAEGKKALHVEEVQSDWHQAGHDEGYKTKPLDISDMQAKLDAIVAQLNKWRGQIPPGVTNPIERSRWLETHFPAYENVLAQRKQLEKEIAALTEEEERKVPDAPFKKNWHELAMKGALRYAAQIGADKLTWTTGQQQIDRYHIPQRLHTIYYYRLPDGKVLISGGDFGDGKSLAVHEYTPSELKNLLGREIARRILRNEGEPTPIFQGSALLGEGRVLKHTPGEGMKSFYDRILPQWVQKYVKKWGGRVGTSYIPVESAGESGDEKGHHLAEVHSVEITPQMRQALLHEGQPLWGDRDALQKSILILFRRRKPAVVLVKAMLRREPPDPNQLTMFPELTPPPMRPMPVYLKPTAEALHTHQQENKYMLERLASFHGVTVPQFKREIVRSLKGLIKGTTISTRVPHEVLPAILRSGRLKSQFETNSSMGMLDPSIRARWEKWAWGIPYDADPAQHRPIYGYLHPSEGDNPDSLAANYGKVRLQMKPHMIPRTSFTWGDSLDSGAVPAPITTPTHYTINYLNEFLPLPFHVSNINDMWEYVEAQMHGGVNVSDIDHVELTEEPDAEVLELLRQHDLPWKVRGEDTLQKAVTDSDIEQAKKDIILAVRGSQYLLVPPDADLNDLRVKGRILDLDQKRLSPPLCVHSILKHGYWEPYEGDQRHLQTLLQAIL